MYYTRMAMLAYSRPPKKNHEVREKRGAEGSGYIYICAAVAVEFFCQKAPEWNGSAI
jgi:hypothetical protein